MRRKLIVPGLALLVVVGVGVLVWRAGLGRGRVELVDKSNNAVVTMPDEQALVDFFETHGWWKRGMRAIMDPTASDSQVTRYVPRRIIIEVTDTVQPFEDLGEDGQIMASFGVFAEGKNVRVRLQVTPRDDVGELARMMDLQLTKAAVMEGLIYQGQDEAAIYNEMIAGYQQGRWPGLFEVQ